MNLTAWSNTDLENHKLLEDFLVKKASWSGTTAEIVQLHRALVWYSGLKKKIEDSQAEIIAYHPPTPPERQPGKKATREARAAKAKE